MEDTVRVTGTGHVACGATGSSSSHVLTSSSSVASSGVSDSERCGHIAQNVSLDGGVAGQEALPVVYKDIAVTVEETGGRLEVTQETQEERHPPDNIHHRLLLVSSKIRNSSIMKNALLPNVIFVQYKYDSSTLESILGAVGQNLGKLKVDSVALVMSCMGSSLHLCGKEEKIINKESILEIAAIRDFFNSLVKYIDKESDGARLDFLSCASVTRTDADLIVQEIKTLVGIPVRISKDILGTQSSLDRDKDDGIKNVSIGELYFRVEKLRGWSGQQQQTLAGFQKIQTVGKGAYGAAVLYRKKDDDSLVILKEINMHDLTAAERQLALNEVNILAMLDHPNIISYYDSFEEDGVLMIEMEYANGGTVAQFLSQRDEPLKEKDILCMFQQIVAAMRHIHEHNILHRDLKTANIFLTKEGVVKLGDFGISKMLSTANKGANTVLGTPYYISPELCEGKPYNDKSDIWAMGCILYEMACLQKTFEGSNLPALVNKIMKGQFAPVKENYSQEMKNLIMDMLKQEPDQRPSANEIMYQRLPELMSKFEEPTTDYDDDATQMTGIDSPRKRLRSVLYYFESYTAGLIPVELPPKIKIKQTAVGEDHVIVLTNEKQVFTWGDGNKGQLGHGDTVSKAKPEIVEALKGKAISRACCGNGFSVFSSDNGIVLTCGDGSHGCLGHGDWSATCRPRLIEPLLSTDVIAVACGPHHVVAVGSEGEVYSWGQGVGGRLGLGNEESQCQPRHVDISGLAVITDVRCGADGTMFLTDVGSVYACGNNTENKLGLNNRQGFIMAMKNIFTKTEVEGQKLPTLVRALIRHRVLDMSMGSHHTAVIVEPGYIHMFGRNSEGQLGIGNIKLQSNPVAVKHMAEKSVNRVQCGEHYTVASTIDNQLYYWGLRFKLPVTVVEDIESRSSTNGSMINSNDLRLESVTPNRSSKAHSRQASSSSITSNKENVAAKSQHNITSHSRQPSTTSVGSVASLTADNENEVCSEPVKQPATRQISRDSIMSTSLTDSGLPCSPPSNEALSITGFRPLSSLPRRSASASSSKETKEKDKEQDSDYSEIIYPPSHLMRLLENDETITFSSFFCHGENLFIQVETSAPAPRRRSRKKRGIRKRFSGTSLNVPKEAGTTGLFSASSREGGDEYSSEASEMDTHGPIHTWIKQELAYAVTELKVTDGNEADDTSSESEDELRRGTVDCSVCSIQINRELTPCKMLEMTSPRSSKVTQKGPTTITQDTAQTEKSDGGARGGSLSMNSTESEVDCPSAGFTSDSSTKDANLHTGEEKSSDPGQKSRKRSAVTTARFGTPALYRPKLPTGPSQRLAGRLRGTGREKGQDVALKEQLAARGFVSDVTVKRREEALLTELEMTRLEKKHAEERLSHLETQYNTQSDRLRQEAEKQASIREITLHAEIDKLKEDLVSQNSQLQDNQRIVMALQEQLAELQVSQQRLGPSRSLWSPRGAGPDKDSRVCSVQ